MYPYTKLTYTFTFLFNAIQFITCFDHITCNVFNLRSRLTHSIIALVTIVALLAWQLHPIDFRVVIVAAQFTHYHLLFVHRISCLADLHTCLLTHLIHLLSCDHKLWIVQFSWNHYYMYTHYVCSPTYVTPQPMAETSGCHVGRLIKSIWNY